MKKYLNNYIIFNEIYNIIYNKMKKSIMQTMYNK